MILSVHDPMHLMIKHILNLHILIVKFYDSIYFSVLISKMCVCVFQVHLIDQLLVHK